MTRDVMTLKRGEHVMVHESKHVTRHAVFAGVVGGRIVVDNSLSLLDYPLDTEYPQVKDMSGRIIRPSP
ncbi:hypothetical protein DEU34_2231 [Microbacterium sp. AG1240]|nr:hypothetical protein DEU34_2231 [Microbacterium sp. AG1240]